MEISYNKMNKIDKFQARNMLIEAYKQTNSIKATAKEWKTSRNVLMP